MRTVCGLDVHKDSVFLCILHDSGEIIEKVFGVLTHQLLDMRRMMQSHGVSEVTMESTAVYWIPVWRVLEPHFHLKLVNPYFIKQLPGRTSDVKDAQWIAECTLKDLVRGSFVPPERIQQLRQYDRRIFDLDAEIVRKLAKLDGVMQRCNIRLSNYVSNTDTKSYKNVVRKLFQLLNKLGGFLVCRRLRTLKPQKVWLSENRQFLHQLTLSRNSSNDSLGSISMPSPRRICALASSTREKNSSLVRSVGSASFSATSLRRYFATRFIMGSLSARIPMSRHIWAFNCTAVISFLFDF